MHKNPQRALTYAFCFYAVSSLISMAVMSIGAGILFLALVYAFGGPLAVFRGIREGVRQSDERRYLWASVALALACILSLALGLLFPLSYDQKTADIHLFKDSLKLWYLFWPLLLVAGLRKLTTGQRNWILKSWFLAFFLLCGVAFIQHFTGWPRPQAIPTMQRPLRYHATLFLGHHLSVASIFIFPFFAALDFAHQAVRQRFKPSASERILSWHASVWLLIVGFGSIGLFLTYSKTLWLALPVGLTVWTLLNLPRRWTYGLIFSFVLSMLGAYQVRTVRERFFHVSFLEGLGNRLHLWAANLEFIRQRPFFGVGWKHNQELSGYYLLEKYPGQQVFSGHAHNNLLDVLGGTGVIGAVAWLGWCTLVIVLSMKALKRMRAGLLNHDIISTVFASGLFCAWIAFHVNGLTQVNFWEAKVTHQMMWVVAWTLLWLSPGASSEQVKDS